MKRFIIYGLVIIGIIGGSIVGNIYWDNMMIRYLMTILSASIGIGAISIIIYILESKRFMRNL